MKNAKTKKGLAHELQVAGTLSDLARTQRGIVDLQTRKVKRQSRAVGSPIGLAAAFGAGAFAGMLRGPSREQVALRKLDKRVAAMGDRLEAALKARHDERRGKGEQLATMVKSLATSIAIRYLAGALVATRTGPSADGGDPAPTSPD